MDIEKSALNDEPLINPPKRRRGRPRKMQVNEIVEPKKRGRKPKTAV